MVGGAIRDLALAHSAAERCEPSVAPREVDLATDLTPDRIEALFEQTVGVGKAFGTMIVVWKGLGIEVTTFRSERGYSDHRRPDQVTYGSSVEEDAARRDFTCNALYLDPISDEFRDPVHGLDDLSAGVLRCVGEARERFREDGLRILRLARFAARLGLVIEDSTLDAARAELDSLRGVSPERTRMEFEKIFAGPRSAEAFATLQQSGAAERCIPGWLEGSGGAARLLTLKHLGDGVNPAIAFAALFDPQPRSGVLNRLDASLAALDALKPARELRRTVGDLWNLQGPLQRAASGSATRAERLRLYRDPNWGMARQLFLARGVGALGGVAMLDAESDRTTPAELRPAGLLTADDLVAAGVPRGPQFGAVLRALEDEQLEGRVTDREAALQWLSRQLGGNQRRTDQANG